MFGGWGVNMNEAQIDIKKYEKTEKVHWVGGCRLSTGGGGIYTS